MKPRQCSAVYRSRASLEDGATRKTRDSPVASLAPSQSDGGVPASSGVRSGVMTPAPPASTMASAKRRTP
jgi:hypothetical protein